MERTADTIKALKRASRALHKGMRKGGFHSAPRGKKVYTRKQKHQGKDADLGELT